jgi:serine protease Do
MKLKVILVVTFISFILSPYVFAQTGGDEGLSSFEKVYKKATEKIEKSIVSIKVIRRQEAPQQPRPPVPGMPPAMPRPDTPVSGVIIDKEGYILTSYFNVSGSVRKIEVTTSDGKKCKAKLVGFDGRKDIALLKIEGENLPVPEKGNVKLLKIGQMVLAVGKNAKGKELIINTGIISAFGRLWGGIQFDARLNFANVGGALIDLEGKLIGVTCQISLDPRTQWGQNSGVSFAISIEEINEILPLLKEGKKTGAGRPAMLGITWDDSAEVEGVKVKEVLEGSAAKKAKIKPGDIIIEFDGKKITRFDELYKATFMKDAGNRVKIKVIRDGEEREFNVRLGAREDMPPARRQPPRRQPPEEEEDR